jgi:hypothetical protein
MKSQRDFLIVMFFTFLAVGGLLGAFVLAPAIHIVTRTGWIAGLLGGFALSLLIYPEYKRTFVEKPSEMREERLAQSRILIAARAAYHPLRLPKTIALYLLILCIILGLMSPLWEPLFSIIIFVLAGAAFLVGLSGFASVIRKEYITIRGNRIRGNFAMFYGIAETISCWGAMIALLYLLIRRFA